MLSKEEIEFYLKLFKGLSLENLLLFLNLTKKRTLEVNDIYIEQGSKSRKLAFIRRGLIRAFHVKENGDDVTLFLRWENQFLASHDSIVKNRPSRYVYQALEKTDLIEMDFDQLDNLLNNTPELAEYRTYFLLQMLSEALEGLESFVLLSPEERYLKLIREKPNIVNRVHDKHIATMLGITPVSLSRIRKRITGTPLRN